MDDDLKRYLDAIEERNAAEHVETRRHFDLSMETIRRHFDLSIGSTRRHSDLSMEAIQGHFNLSMGVIRPEVQLLANLIAQLSEKIDATNINATVERTAAETQALIIRCTTLATACRPGIG